MAALEPSLVLLELKLPDMEGLRLCEQIRVRDSPPIILIACGGSEAETLAGFEAGADGYVTKPYRLRELSARIHAALRRAPPSVPLDLMVLTVGDVTLDPSRHEVRVGGSKVDMPLREFELLNLFMTNPGKVLTREALMRRIWGRTPPSGTKSLDVHVRRIRAKIDGDQPSPSRIVTVRGVGYKYAAPPPVR